MTTRHTLAVLAHLLLSSTTAQYINETATCEEVDARIRYNTSTTREIPALSISGDVSRRGALSESLSIEKDESRKWSLTLGVQEFNPSNGPLSGSRDNETNFEQILLLDTADSNLTGMGVCHQIAQVETRGSGFQWLKETLQNSINDNGDCNSFLGSECVQALKSWYTEQAASHQLVSGSCVRTNNTWPTECSPQRLASIPMDLNGTLTTSFSPFLHNTSHFDPSLDCDTVNVSSTHGVQVAQNMNYDAAVRFPLIDVVTFWPNRSGVAGYDNSWRDDVHVEVVCLKPDQIEDGSKVPPTAQEQLDSPNSRFPTSGAMRWSGGMLSWLSAVVVGIVLVY